MRLGNVLVAAALAAGLLTSAPAQAADPPPETSTPVVTPPVWQKELPDNQLVSVSDQFAMHRRTWKRDGVYPGYPVVRLSDGEVVQEFKPDPAASGFPRLSGGAILQDFTNGTDYNEKIDVIDAETGALRGSLVAPKGEGAIASEAEWMLTLWKPTSDTTAARVRWLDGRTLDVALPNQEITGTSHSIGVIGSKLYLSDQTRLVALDLDTGTVTRLVGPDATDTYPYGFWNAPFLSGDRIVQVKRDWSNNTYTAFWYDAATLTEHVTPLNLPGDGTIHPFGNDLAQAVGAYGETKTLYRIDLDTGEVSAPFGQALEVKRTDAGRLVVTLDEDPDDGIGVVADDGAGVRRVADLPRVPEWMSTPWIDGDTVSALVGANDLLPMSTSVDGSSPWVGQVRRFRTAGDTRLEEIPDPNGADTSRWELSWPGGSRVIEPASKVTLGHGGELVVVEDREVQRVRPAADGSVDVVLPRQQRAAVADGSWVWLAPDADKVVRGFDADDPTRTRAVDSGVGCAGMPTIEARDGFMLVTCSLGWSYVVDLSGKVPTWRVPLSDPGQVVPALGNGFIAYTYLRAWTPEAPAREELRIADLTPEHRTTVITDVGGLGRYRFGVDESGGRRVAYQNNSGLVAIRDVTRADTTAPVATDSGLDQPAAVASSDPVQVHFHATWSDAPYGLESASGLATVDVRRRTRTADTDWSAWQTAAEGVGSADASLEVQPGTGVCFSSRARDEAGNISDWSEPRCSVIDGVAPTRGHITGPARFDAVSQGGLRFGYQATDDFGVASYDVRTRLAKPGRLPGAWTDRVQATTAQELSVPATAGSEWCVRFRARDVAGNVTGWSAPRCTAVAYDDRALDISGATARRRSALALYGTVTVLKSKGATARLAQIQRGRTLAVWVLRGPDQGALDVWVGATKVGRIRTAAPTWRRALIQLPLATTGRVRFTAVGARPVRFDGFTVGR